MQSSPTPPSSSTLLRHVRRLLLTAAALAAVFAISPPTASAGSCWRELVNDYWADNRVDRTYPISCYREAMEKLPEDVQQYSDAQDDLRRALLAAIRDERDSGGGFTGPDDVLDEDGPTSAAGPGGGAGGGGDDAAPEGFIGEVLSKLGPKNADSIPVPLLVLGAIALLLIGAAGVSYGARYLQARRVTVATAPGPPNDPLS